MPVVAPTSSIDRPWLSDLEAGDQAALPVGGLQELVHRVAREAGFALRVREQLDGGDVGVGVGDAPRHQRARVGLVLGHLRQPGHEMAAGQRIQRQPGAERHHHAQVEAAHHRDDGEEVDQHVGHDVGEQEPGVAHRQRRLHHLGRDAARELVLVEGHALAQHQAVEQPAHAHGEVREQRLVLQQRPAARDADADRQQHRQREQLVAFALPQLRRRHPRQQVDDMCHHREQQRLEGTDDRGEQRQDQQQPPRSLRVLPQEREEAVGQRVRLGRREGRHERLEALEQGRAPLGAGWAPTHGAAAVPGRLGGGAGIIATRHWIGLHSIHGRAFTRRRRSRAFAPG
jgi:hypothetical protein